MLTPTLKSLFARDLNKLRTEIELYQNEQSLWLINKNIANPAGNLCLHLIGNLNHFIGNELGGTGYVRDRPLEFSRKDVPRTELITAINDAIMVVETTLDKLTAEDLAKEYPIIVFEKATSTEYFLVHLAMHLAYHLGQINYHRRFLDDQKTK